MVLWCVLLLTPVPVFAARLPRTVVPVSYKMVFTPDLSLSTFEGDEVIRLQVKTAVSRIVLNSAELAIHDVWFTQGRRQLKGSVTTDDANQTATLSFPRKLSTGEGDLRIVFSGNLNDNLRGFYRSRGKGRNYAVTQFEATDARRAFPSFDEPDFKATFDVTLVIDSGDTAISNGRIVSDIPGPGAGKHTLKFSTSPKMSTYLVAMAVGDFQCLASEMDGVPIRICATPEKKDLGAFALESTRHILHFYDHYYGQKYPFEKLDIVAVPDFAAGAMENAGAIFYRETALLINDKTAAIESHRTVADVLAHEIAHMWFGDLVTMKWWDDIWLNEGFATWMTAKPVAEWKPEWNVEADEARSMMDTIRLDTLGSTRPIRTSAETPKQIFALFDAIAYQKTSAVLRMIEHYVGEETFRKGINLYLSRHAYGNATGEDFWNTMTEVSGKPVAAIMKSYVDNPGVPLLSVKSRCSATGTKITIRQEPYKSILNGAGKGSQAWSVPVCFKSPGTTGGRCELLNHDEQSFELDGCQPAPFINAGAYGYFITDYGKEGIAKLAPSAEKNLTPEERLSLAGDEWALVRAGKQGVADYLGLLDAGYRGESDSSVLTALSEWLGYIGERLVPEASQSRYQFWVAGFLGPVGQKLGWSTRPGDSDEQRTVRALVFERLGRTAGDPEVLSHARADVEAAMKGVEPVDANLLPAAMTIAAEHGDAALYDRLLAHLKTAKSPQEVYTYAEALPQFRDPSLIDRTIAYAMSNEVRGQDRVNMLIRLMNNPSARPRVWALFRDRFDELRSMPRVASLVGSFREFCDDRTLHEIRAFFEAHPIPGAERNLKFALEQIAECSALHQGGSSMESWLEAHGPGGAK